MFHDEDEAFVLTLNSATARPSQIKRVLKEQRGKNFTTKKIQNLIRKLAPTDAEENVSFEDFLQKLEDEGGTVEWKCDPDETVSALFIATKSQKSSVISSQPAVIQLDTSFGVDQAHYKLTAFCYLNPVTNKTRSHLLHWCRRRVRKISTSFVSFSGHTTVKMMLYFSSTKTSPALHPSSVLIQIQLSSCAFSM